MNCPKCGELMPDNAVSCPTCGFDIEEQEKLFAPDKKEKGDEKKLEKSSSKKKKRPSGDEKKPRHIRRKIALGLFAAAIIVLCVVFAVAQLNAGKGSRIAARISDEALGRSIEIAESKLNITLSEQSRFDYLAKVEPYNYIIEDENNVRVCGITLPGWASLVTTNAGGKISKVTYYDFSVLQSDWKGKKLPSDIDSASIQYGMNVSDAEKIIGFKPYSITRTVDDMTIYNYRYYYVDPETGNDKAYSFEVDVDLEGRVKSLTHKEINFMNFILTC